MQLKKGDSIDVEIEKLVFGGKGLGRVDFEDKKNYVVFVEGGIPGDFLNVRLYKIKNSYAEASIEKIIKPSEIRIKPKCIHFGECGGCALQNISYEDQLQFKKEHIAESLEKIGGLKNVKIKPVIPCASPWNYRNKFEYSFGFDDNLNLNIGFHKKGRRFDIVDLKECHLGPEYIVDLLNDLRDFFAGKKIPPYNFKNNTGILKSLYFREGKNTNKILINLVVNQLEEGDPFPGAHTGDQNFQNSYLKIVQDWAVRNKLNLSSVYLTKILKEKGRKTLITEHLLFGCKHLDEKMIVDDTTLDFQILPQAFFQPNTFQAQKLYEQVLKYADLEGNETVFDLYCGTGTISLFLAKKARNVIGIEVVEDAIKNAVENAKLNNIKNVEFITGPVEKKLSGLTFKPDLIVVDPPRAGISPKVIEKICNIKAQKIVYVSCNPTTLARDLAELTKSGYKLKEVQPVDMFPHTYHIECAAKLTR